MRYLFAIFAAGLLPAVALADDSVPSIAAATPASGVAVTNLLSSNPAGTTNSTTATNSTPFKPPMFKTAIMQDKVPGVSLDVRYGILITGTNRITFVIPEKMGMQPDSAKQKVELQSRDGSYISLRVLSGDDARLLELKPGEIRDQVSGRYTQSKITGESAIAIESLSGPAYEIQWIAGGRAEMYTRIGFVPFGKELIEINLTCAKDNTPTYAPVLSELALSFRIGPVDGPLKVRKFFTDF